MNSVALPETGLPLVGEDSGNRGLWLGLGGIVLAGLLLFAALEANRRSNASPAVASPNDYATAATPPPSLVIPENVVLGPYLPPTPQDPNGAKVETPPAVEPPKLPPVRLEPTPQPERRPAAPPSFTPSVMAPPQPNFPSIPDPGRSAPTIVYDVATGRPATPAGGEVTAQSARAAPAIASEAIDRSNLVSQGTLIYAVLETALDSTQVGQARALISKNVYNSSGTKVLIPKGSRVFGEYRAADVGAGQNRAQIIWGRLIRPDGVTISLDSPASDQLGRAGVKGSLDTHFGERLLNALLQSTIDFGSAVASRAVTSDNGIIVAVPNAAQRVGSGIVQPPRRPTLRVKHGTRIAVFVARDLDFSAVE
jgi:type IV secretion system protein VirB10